MAIPNDIADALIALGGAVLGWIARHYTKRDNK